MCEGRDGFVFVDVLGKTGDGNGGRQACICVCVCRIEERHVKGGNREGVE